MVDPDSSAQASYAIPAVLLMPAYHTASTTKTLREGPTCNVFIPTSSVEWSTARDVSSLRPLDWTASDGLYIQLWSVS